MVRKSRARLAHLTCPCLLQENEKSGWNSALAGSRERLWEVRTAASASFVKYIRRTFVETVGRLKCVSRRGGQALIQRWIRFIRRPEARFHIVFLSDYDAPFTERLVTDGVAIPWEAAQIPWQR
jgi:hypothetical protein